MANYCLRCGKKIGLSGSVEIHGGMLCRKCATYYSANKPDHGFSVPDMTYSDLLIADKKIRAAKTRRRTRNSMLLFCLAIAIVAGAAITFDHWFPRLNNLIHLVDSQEEEAPASEAFDLESIPDWSGETYVLVNGNVPGFTEEEIEKAKAVARGVAGSEEEFPAEQYSPLDKLGRCGPAMICIDKTSMPEGERGEIGTVRPSGWNVKRYDYVDEKYVFNRCHLIGWQFTGQNSEPKNLITGTRYLNIDAMLPFENQAAKYLRWTENHILYRVTPHFSGRDLVCRGVQIEALSVDDDGDGLSFNVFCYNVQPGVVIDYSTGKTAAADNWEEIAEEYSKKTDSVVLPQKEETSRSKEDEDTADKDDSAGDTENSEADDSGAVKTPWSYDDSEDADDPGGSAAPGDSPGDDSSGWGSSGGEDDDDGWLPYGGDTRPGDSNDNGNNNTDGYVAVRAVLFLLTPSPRR